jgi:hypothetical protein
MLLGWIKLWEPAMTPPTGYQIATEVTLTQIGIQATASYKDDMDKLACTVASSVFTWVRLKAVNETTGIGLDTMTHWPTDFWSKSDSDSDSEFS